METVNSIIIQAGLRTDVVRSMADAVTKSAWTMLTPPLDDVEPSAGYITVTYAVNISSAPTEYITTVAVVDTSSSSADSVSVCQMVRTVRAQGDMRYGKSLE